MSESALKSAYEAVLTLPEEDQEQVAEMMRQFVEERSAPSLLTEEQKAEVRRRLADPNPVLVPQEEVFAKLRKHLGI